MTMTNQNKSKGTFFLWAPQESYNTAVYQKDDTYFLK